MRNCVFREDEEILDSIDTLAVGNLVRQDTHVSKSEFVRDACRRELARRVEESKAKRPLVKSDGTDRGGFVLSCMGRSQLVWES